MDPIRDRVQDPTEEIFWRKVAEAYNIATTRDQQVSFELGELRCDIEAGAEATFIVITSATPSVQPLVIPPGSMTLDPRDSQETEDEVTN